MFSGALLLAMGASAQRSPFNGRTPAPPDSTGHFRLVISGHFHGTSTNRSGFPAATLLANLDTINRLDADLLLSTGDLFMDVRQDTANYRRALFDRLQVPLFNAVGNHDLSGDVYQQAFGSTFSTFVIGTTAFAILDTERDNGRILGEQLDAIKALVDRPDLQRAFIISHRPVWSEGDPRYGPLFAGNTRSMLGNNFSDEVLPLLRSIARRTEVFWVSGSMAGGAPSSVFFQPEAPGITYIQSAIRDEARDALLVADIDRQGVRWSMCSLTGRPTGRVEDLGTAYWSKHKRTEPPFNWRLLPYLVKTTVAHRAFWWGLGAGVFLLWLLARLFRRGLR